MPKRKIEFKRGDVVYIKDCLLTLTRRPFNEFERRRMESAIGKVGMIDEVKNENGPYPPIMVKFNKYEIEGDPIPKENGGFFPKEIRLATQYESDRFWLRRFADA